MFPRSLLRAIRAYLSLKILLQKGTIRHCVFYTYGTFVKLSKPTNDQRGSQILLHFSKLLYFGGSF